MYSGMSKAAFTPGQHVARQQVPRSGNMLPVSGQRNYYSFMSRGWLVYTLCIQQQTGNKLATILLLIYKQHVDGNTLPGNMLLDVNAA